MCEAWKWLSARSQWAQPFLISSQTGLEQLVTTSSLTWLHLMLYCVSLHKNILEEI